MFLLRKLHLADPVVVWSRVNSGITGLPVLTNMGMLSLFGAMTFSDEGFPGHSALDNMSMSWFEIDQRLNIYSIDPIHATLFLVPF